MTAAEARKLVAVWAERLGIGHYELLVEVVPFDDATNAQVVPSEDYERARIQLNPTLLTGQKTEGQVFEEDAETVIVHELLHVAVNGLTRTKRLLEETHSLHRDAQRMFDETWDQREEEVVDRLAVALVRAWRSR